MTEWTPAALDRLWTEIQADPVDWPCVALVNGRECECTADTLLLQECHACRHSLRSPICAGHYALMETMVTDRRVTVSCKQCDAAGRITYTTEPIR